MSALDPVLPRAVDGGKEPKYRPRVILVTGGAGFIGSHVCSHLVRAYPEYTVVCLDSLEYCASARSVDDCRAYPNFIFVHGSVCDEALVQQTLGRHGVDTVLHFAAQSHVDVSFGCPLAFTRVNTLGTHIMLEYARLGGVRRFIHVSTDEVYGETDLAAASESATWMQPTNPYAGSKCAAEAMVSVYARCFDTPVMITRGNNVYGARQFPEKAIPKFIMRLLRGRPCCVHGDGLARRSFVHISDVVRCYDLLLHYGEVGPAAIYNIGTPSDLTVLDMARAVVRHVMGVPAGHEDLHITREADRLYNDRAYRLDVSKLTALGWTPAVSLDEGLRATVEWYRRMADEYWGPVDYALTAHPAHASWPNLESGAAHAGGQNGELEPGAAKAPLEQRQ